MTKPIEELNPAQQEAVEYLEGPLMVLAGPGTGKTKVVTSKIAHLIQDKGLKAEEILALTFSNKASLEMEKRVKELIPEAIGFQISTFHSFCNEVVRTHSLELGLDASGSVISDNFQKAFLLGYLDQLGLEFFDVPLRPVELADTFQGAISRFKQENITIERLEEYLAARAEAMDEETAKLRDLAKAYRAYETFKAEKRLQDFGDMQLNILKLFEERPAVLERYREQFKYVIVDEFQDSDFIQLQILFRLAPGGNITVVSDDDQSIYRFRGAYSTNMVEFNEFYEGRGLPVKRKVLDINYRCTANIQTIAGNLIVNNPSREAKEITTAKGPGVPVSITHYLNDWEQAKGITRAIIELHKAGHPWDDMAILVRRRIDSVSIIENLEKAGVPVEIIGAREYFREPVVSAVVAYLKVLSDPGHNQPALGQLLLRPVHGLNPGEIQALGRYAKDHRCSHWEALGDLGDFKGDATHLASFKEELDRLSTIMGDEGLLHLVRAVLFGKDLFRVEIAQERTENIRLLSRFLELTTEFLEVYPNASLHDFLLHIEALASLKLEEASVAEGAGQVRLMTVHGSKGMQFPIVFVPSLNKDRFPSRYKPYKLDIPRELNHGADLDADPKELHLEEERRLCYVAITRAKDEVYLSSYEMYGSNKNPTPRSTFLEEIEQNQDGFEGRGQTELMDELEERSTSVESAIHHRLFNGIHRKEWPDAIEALTALAIHQGDDVGQLFVPAGLDLERYIEQLKIISNEPLHNHLEDIVYSPSRLKLYEDCPKRYWYSHVLRIPGMPKTFFSLGTLMHDVCEQVASRIKDGDTVSVEEAMAMLEAKWRPSVYDYAEQEQEDRTEAETMIRSFMARQATKDTRIIDLEKKVRVEVEGHVIEGYVDRIDDLGDSLQVIDYKTTKERTSKPKLKKDFQMALYQLGVAQAYGKPVSDIGHWYLRMDQEWMVQLSAEELDAVRQRALAVIQGIEAGSFEATPGYQTCMWCDYGALCGEGG